MKSSGDAERIVASPVSTRPAVRHALLQAKIAIERERRAVKIELRLERQIELIDVAASDVALNLFEPLQVGNAIPTMGQLAECRIADRFFGQPALDFGTGQFARTCVEAKPEERHFALRGQQRAQVSAPADSQARKRRSRRRAGRATTRLQSSQRAVDIGRRVSADDFNRMLEKLR